MTERLHLDESLLFSEGATRECYRHPNDETLCLKIEKVRLGTNEQDLAAYSRVKGILGPYIVVYGESLLATNLGKALCCELIRDHDGSLSQSFAEYRRERVLEDSLRNQFTAFFNTLQLHDLFFYDLNPRNFMIQRLPNGEHLMYTDLKSLGRIRTLFALERISFFARRKLKRRIRRFVHRFLLNQPKA